jgi:methylated-DNA-protein-cysteine methyltransferase related protein
MSKRENPDIGDTGEKAYSPLSIRLLDLIRSIPKGKVASYGRIAAMAGSPRGARQVVRLLHTLSEKEKLPWHRVLNSRGRISLPLDGTGGLQRRLLLKEGVKVDAQGAVDLNAFGWSPGGKAVPPAISRGGPARSGAHAILKSRKVPQNL